MGLFDKLFKPKKEPEQAVAEYFHMLNAYNPAFTSFEGSLYEMELTRAAVHSFATHVSKLKPEVQGAGGKNKLLAKRLLYKPNPWMDTSKYLYRLATIFMVNNNAFIVPLEDDYGDIEGYVPIVPDNADLIDFKGRTYVRFSFGVKKAAVELSKVGILNQFQYKNDFFGESNKPLGATLDLMHAQNEGIVEGIKNSASIRFMAKLAHALSGPDMKKERERFTKQNLSIENTTGLMIFDSKYEEIKQIESKPYVVDDRQMKQIKENVFFYFGTNEDILLNRFNSESWGAYYEGKIEPFAIQASLVHTNMTFTEHELSFGNNIIFTANRLQYLSNNEKLATVTQLFDRGFLTHNMGLEIFNMKGIGEEGDKRFIRKEYAETEFLEDDDSVTYKPLEGGQEEGEENEPKN